MKKDLYHFLLECGCSGTDADCPIGDCECEGQVRINNDCTYAKLVHNNFPSSSNDYDFLEFAKKKALMNILVKKRMRL